MNPQFTVHAAQYFTATIYEWQNVLSENNHKDIIIDSLQYLVNDKRIELNAFVIMNNHIHLIWQPLTGFTPSGVQASFMKYTAQQLKRSLIKNEPEKIETFKVNKYDREYQVWKREPLSIEPLNESMFVQKLEYIPVQTDSSGRALQSGESWLMRLARRILLFIARFYVDGANSFGMLTHYSGN